MYFDELSMFFIFKIMIYILSREKTILQPYENTLTFCLKKKHKNNMTMYEK